MTFHYIQHMGGIYRFTECQWRNLQAAVTQDTKDQGEGNIVYQRVSPEAFGELFLEEDIMTMDDLYDEIIGD